MNLGLLHIDVVPSFIAGISNIFCQESCVCGSNDSTVSHHSICLPIADAGAAECVDAQTENENIK